MLFNNIFSVFAVTAVASAQSVDDFKYNKFPVEEAICAGVQGQPATTWTLSQLKELAVAASKGRIYDNSAGNVGGSPCANMYGIPYYAVSLIQSL